jgi:prepilin-type N-terminal cleavage/methylation domain-containing protein
MKCAHSKNHNGFTLVEISIVMIIIGLLVGGTFGGMALVENMRVSRTVQDLKAIESASVTFSDTFGRLPGDIRNPSSRLPNCTVAPCATSGNGNRFVEPLAPPGWSSDPAVTEEKFVFWHHLAASGMVDLRIKNSTQKTFGDGIARSALNAAGFRISNYSGPAAACAHNYTGHWTILTSSATGEVDSTTNVPCNFARKIDLKLDDGRQWQGKIIVPSSASGQNCNSGSLVCGNGYTTPNNMASGFIYLNKF